MSRKKSKLDKEIPIGLSGFSLAPGFTGCSDFPEKTSPRKQSGQSDPPLKTQIENELRGIPLPTQVDVLTNLLLLLEQEDASFKNKMYGNHNHEHSAVSSIPDNCTTLG